MFKYTRAKRAKRINLILNIMLFVSLTIGIYCISLYFLNVADNVNEFFNSNVNIEIEINGVEK